MHKMTWKDIRGIYKRLSSSDKEKFVTYLRSMQDNEDNSEPQPYESLKGPQNNA